MRSCIKPGLSGLISGAGAFIGEALPLTSVCLATPFVCFLGTSASFCINCEEGARWSGFVCFCRPIAAESDLNTGCRIRSKKTSKPKDVYSLI